MNRKSFLQTVGLGALGLHASKLYAATSPPAAPPQALANGYSNLIFSDEFDVMPDIGYGTDGHKWNAGLWWETPPSPSAFSQAGSVLTIQASATQAVDLCTQYHDYSGGERFMGGYFEARMNCFDWSAFWLLCWDRPTVYGSKVDPNNPLTWTNEIDIVETDPGYPYSAWCTLHKNSSGDSLPDQQNYPAEMKLNTASVGYWHNYGLLWTQAQLTWFIDEIPVLILPPYASTWQPVQLILTASPGGVNGSQSKTLPPITKVDYVRVWGQ